MGNSGSALVPYQDDEWYSLGEFAVIIEERAEAKMKNAIEQADAFPERCHFHGFTPLGIASMHSQGTWVIEMFGNEERCNIENREFSLKPLADELSLNVDDDILNDKGYTPIALAVMFGPIQSVKKLIERGARTEFLTMAGNFSLQQLAFFRNDDEICALLKDEENTDHAQCRACRRANCVIS
uniref:Ankyrin repeat domain-containing protein n=1 Tax=Lotharella globosa TaxID=91324 RepID=A0A7S3YWJ3_9EUKA|mmetsp:Transcript_7953/g.15544  ORF Transcript_7953/g.15544 Transcript_7953/m.15544 type:complete len:183 (-) Transcript_7953:25-573(-)|eukprot:CAMPEP_0167818368 /NCGR_PEP_ID=MMETSP0112_2-20121227/4759_1 /TAXON_ID=91324 /ORGANISM="Lotharella globosa, Strain CCCM811" /LENGTH=182 /DNA_ID=CAMNT_0007718331 /DNA_START=51 /DNA_END=599 /DNA_ORIENTATION=+